MTAIIIEDEALAARELESILKKLAPEIEIVARQDSVRGSVQWLKENQVDLIFSDVHLGDGRSFDIFGQVEIKAPVIFITAYDEYALQAFKSQGIDYILKPFDEEEILRALEKVRNWFAKEKKAPRTVRFQERFFVQIGKKIKNNRSAKLTKSEGADGTIRAAYLVWQARTSIKRSDTDAKALAKSEIAFVLPDGTAKLIKAQYATYDNRSIDYKNQNKEEGVRQQYTFVNMYADVTDIINKSSNLWMSNGVDEAFRFIRSYFNFID